MASRDFIEDAMDSLAMDDQLSFLFIGGHYGHTFAYRRHSPMTKEQLDWLKRRADELFEELYAELNNS